MLADYKPTNQNSPWSIFHNSWQLLCYYNCNILQEIQYLMGEDRKCFLVFHLPLTAKALQNIPAMWKMVWVIKSNFTHTNFVLWQFIEGRKSSRSDLPYLVLWSQTSYLTRHNYFNLTLLPYWYRNLFFSSKKVSDNSERYWKWAISFFTISYKRSVPINLMSAYS